MGSSTGQIGGGGGKAIVSLKDYNQSLRHERGGVKRKIRRRVMTKTTGPKSSGAGN